MTGAFSDRVRLPLWIWIAAAAGAAWNIFGLVQLVDFIGQTRASLMMKGMGPAAAETYYALPIWMKAAFALGSGGGLIACVMLAARQRIAVPIFAASLLGYIALFAGDYCYGVFDLIEGQLGVLSIVVAIAAALLGISLSARRRGLLG